MMRKFLQAKLPADSNDLKKVAVIATVITCSLLVLIGIYGIESYGIALFVMVPLLMGMMPVSLYGMKRSVTKRIAFRLAAATLGIGLLVLLIFAIEGIICVLMSLPILFFMIWVGSLIGYIIITKSMNSATAANLLLVISIPLMSFTEREYHSRITAVVTTIIIDAPAEIVWKNIVEFPLLDEPTEWIFKAGISYPVNATIDGSGVGAIRYCNFNTGSFVEPITQWEDNHLLAFDVKEQPLPMKELSPYDIDAPHLHDFFVSRRGQFKLTAMPDGRTLLEGTTWYTHDIRPYFYWQIWSDFIVHSIHGRVLKHIKKTSELEMKK
jgi:hypothetical protein